LLSVVVGIALSAGTAVDVTPMAQAVSSSGKVGFIRAVASSARSAQRKFGVPASVSIAQAILASDWGTSDVAKKASNFFGTPCSGTMTESQYASLADEQVGKPYVLGANGPRSFDCSSLVIWLDNQSGAYRMGDDTAAGMYNRSRRVTGSPRVGDMVFLRNNPARANGIGHMAVLTKKLSGGEWRIIEARGRAYGVVRSTLSFWKQRSYYAGLRRLPKIVFAASTGAAVSAARLYQSGCVTIGSIRYANFTSMANSFAANAAAIASDAAYKQARSAIRSGSGPAFLQALAKVVKPKDSDGYARSLSALIASYSLTDYDVVPIGIVLSSGNSGAKVTALQYLLKAAGYSVAISGRYDSATVAAVSRFQKSRSLEVDGEAGEDTLSALFAPVGMGSNGPRVSAVNTLFGALGYNGPPQATFGSDTLTWAALFMTLASVQPILRGEAQVGQSLSATPGSWGPGKVTLSYQWYRADSPIDKATASRYDVQAADAGKALKVVVTGSRSGFTVTSRASSATDLVRTASFTSTPIPTVAGTARVGQTLTATAGAWAPGPVSFAFQWFRGSATIPGATSARYRVSPADVGERLAVSSTGSRTGFGSVSKTSSTTATVTRASFSSAAKPRIVGSPKVGRTVTAKHDEWKAGTVIYRYQWYRGATRIKGATSTRYKVRIQDRNRKLSVTVTGVSDGYTTLAKRSAMVRIG
jgi:cell wall-associated NlpC family hydrolase/peptidoglycan hydrolase-like protein with peptidoglycan-binding domain